MSGYWVVIPVYNEARHIRSCLSHIASYTKNIVVVDDGSSDATREILASYKKIRVIYLRANRGKGYAMQVGARAAFRQGAKGVIFMDGDNQHHPKHIPEFINMMRRGAEIVIGVRILKAQIPWHRKLGNFVMAILMQTMFHIHIPDMMCGFRALTRAGYRKVKWTSTGYGVEVEMLSVIGQKRLAFETLVVDTIYLDKYKGFSVRDGIKIALSLPSYKLKAL